MKAPWTFFKYLPMAQRVLAKGRLPVVLLAVARKRSARGGLLKGLREDLGVLQALCVAWWRGEYRAISKPALVAAVAGLLYFLSPMDAIPDWIPGLGFVDDLAVLGWVMRKWSGELQAFQAWRDSQTADVQADIARLPSADEPMAADVSPARRSPT
ncbi:YkvA family protein [Stutzerimonas stutzeri]|uniref:YkvA family protein n=1 Tax=Stutzerimonas stutzeri TaxID=316 RepID=UPI0037146E9C